MKTGLELVYTTRRPGLKYFGLNCGLTLLDENWIMYIKGVLAQAS